MGGCGAVFVLAGGDGGVFPVELAELSVLVFYLIRLSIFLGGGA